MASEKEREQSALINLDSLEVRKPTGPHAGMEESGLIDLSGFTGGGPAESREAAGVPSGGPMIAGFVAAPRQSSNSTLWIALGVIVLLILVGVAVFVGMILAEGRGDPVPIAAVPATPAPVQPGQPPAPAAALPAQPAQPAAPAVAEKAADAGAPDAAGEPKAPEGEGSPAVAANEPPKPARRPARRAGRSASPTPARPSPRPTPSEEDAPPPAAAAAPTPPPTPARVEPPPPKPKENSEVDDMLSALDGDKPSGGGGGGASPIAPVADPMLPESLSRRQILTVVKRSAGAVRKCKAQPPGASGTVMVKMQIAPNGSVTSAEVAGGPVKGTAQGNCVERTVKAFRFPQFGGDPMQINLPFAM